MFSLLSHVLTSKFQIYVLFKHFPGPAFSRQLISQFKKYKESMKVYFSSVQFNRLIDYYYEITQNFLSKMLNHSNRNNTRQKPNTEKKRCIRSQVRLNCIAYRHTQLQTIIIIKLSKLTDSTFNSGGNNIKHIQTSRITIHHRNIAALSV